MIEEGEGSKANKYFQLNYEYAKANKKNINDKGNTETNNTSAIVVEKKKREMKQGRRRMRRPLSEKWAKNIFENKRHT